MNSPTKEEVIEINPEISVQSAWDSIQNIATHGSVDMGDWSNIIAYVTQLQNSIINMRERVKWLEERIIVREKDLIEALIKNKVIKYR